MFRSLYRKIKQWLRSSVLCRFGFHDWRLKEYMYLPDDMSRTDTLAYTKFKTTTKLQIICVQCVYCKTEAQVEDRYKDQHGLLPPNDWRKIPTS